MKKKLIYLFFFLGIFYQGNSQDKKITFDKHDTNINNSYNTSPQFLYKSTLVLENYYNFQHVFFAESIKALFDKAGNIVIAGIDDSKKRIHLQKRNLQNGNSKDYFVYNPFADSLEDIPNLTSFNLTTDSNKFLLVFERKFFLYLEIKKNKLVVTSKMSFNNPELPPYNAYYFYKKLYGIHPVQGIIINQKPYFYEECLAVDILEGHTKTTVYYNRYVNPEFWHYTMTSFVSGLNNKLLLANALKNELVLINLDNKKTDTLKNVIPDFKTINKKFKDSIYWEYRSRKIPSRLGELLNYSDSFNYIFKVIIRSENEIWVIWKGYGQNRHQIKLDIIVFDIKTKTWGTKYHRLVYDYVIKKNEEIVTDHTYPLAFFNNLTYTKGNKLFIIANDNMDFDPIGKTYKEVSESMKKNPKPASIKLYEFEIKEQ